MVPSPTRNSFICGEYDLRMKTRQVTSKLWYEYSRRQSNQLRGEDIVSGQKTEKGKLYVRTCGRSMRSCKATASCRGAQAQRNDIILQQQCPVFFSSPSADPRPAGTGPARQPPACTAPDKQGAGGRGSAWKRKDRWETEDGTGGENVMMPGLTRLDARARVRGLRQLLSRYASRPTACPPLALAPTSDWADSSSLSPSFSHHLNPQRLRLRACVPATTMRATPRPAVLAASSVSPIHPQSPRLPNPCSVVSTGKKFLSCVPFTRART